MIKEKADSTADYDSEAGVYATILLSLQETTREDLLWFHDEYVKCQGEWHDVISQIMTDAHDLGCHSAYCRMGEDLDDIEIDELGVGDESLRVYIPVLRILGEPVVP